jgi:hypothetical protein
VLGRPHPPAAGRAVSRTRENESGLRKLSQDGRIEPAGGQVLVDGLLELESRRVGDVCIVCRGEIAGLRQLLTGSLTRGPARLGSPLEDFAGGPACNIG